MQFKLSRLSFGIFLTTAFSCFLSLVFLQLSGENILNQKDLASKATGAISVPLTVKSAAAVAPGALNNNKDISFLTPAQIKDLADKYSKKLKAVKKSMVTAGGKAVTSGSVSSTDADLQAALKKYKVPDSVQAELDAINSKAITWTANYNPIFAKSDEDFKKMLGLKLDDRILKLLKSGVKTSTKSKSLAPLSASSSLVDNFGDTTLPDYFDWRNVGGVDYITPVKNQGGCGSCWAFGAVGALEGKINAYYNDPTIDQDISEQDLVSCALPYNDETQSGGCSGADSGQIKSIFSNYLVKTGITQDTCFPYTESDSACSQKCSTWASQVWKTDSTYKPLALTDDINANINIIKNAVVNYGPVEVGMLIYDDFKPYTVGIYHNDATYQSNKGHAVTIVGYGIENEIPYWIIKNSWGAWWGENGYMRIRMGSCWIDSWFAFAPGIPYDSNSRAKICTDTDNDGYCFWGLGNKPATGCPLSCATATTEDCNDSIATIHQNCGKLSYDTGYLNISSSQENVQILVKQDDESWSPMGLAPITLRLETGTRQIKGVINDEYIESDNIVSITKDQTASLNVTVSPDPKYNTVYINGPHAFASLNSGVFYSVDSDKIGLFDIPYNGESFWGVATASVYNIKTKSTNQIAEYADSPPIISGDNMVWMGRIYPVQPGGYQYVFQYSKDTGITTNLTPITPQRFDVAPDYADIQGNIAVWKDVDMNPVSPCGDGTNFPSAYYYTNLHHRWYYISSNYHNCATISGYNLTTRESFTIKKGDANSFYDRPKVFGDYVVWSEAKSYGKDSVGWVWYNSYIHLYNIKTKLEKIIDQQPAHTDGTDYLQLSAVIWDNKVVWLEETAKTTQSGCYDGCITTLPKIKLYDIATGVINTIDDQPAYSHLSFKDNKIVWGAPTVQNSTFKGDNIYLYDLDKNQKYQITNNNYIDQINPEVSGSAIVWQNYQGPQNLYMRDITNLTCANAQCVDSVCIPNWTCGAWSACANGQQTRTCTDSNKCGTNANKPATTNSCKLVAYYPFDGNTNDTSGSGNNAINNGVTFASGKIGQAGKFNGASYVNASLPSFDNISLSFWVYRSGSGSSGFPRIIGWTGYGLEIADYDNSGSIGIYTPTLSWQNTGKKLGANWNHIAVTGNGSSLKIYLNGVLANDYQSTFNLSGSMFIGSSYNYAEFFNGNIDEVKIWNYALSSTEVSNEYNSVPKLVAYYPFDGNTNDTSGNGNNGVVNGATLTTGVKGQAYSFDGSNDYISFSDPLSSLPDGSKVYSVGLWFKRTGSLAESEGTLASLEGLGLYNRLELNSSNVFFYFYDGNHHKVSAPYQSGVWNYAVGVRDGDTFKFYLNGNYIGSEVGSGSYPFVTNGNNIGSRSSGGGYSYFFNGPIDEVKIWNYALSSAEIQAEYQASKPVPVTSVAVVSAGNATTVNVGEALQMSVTVLPANASDKSVTWSISSGSTYATIDSAGYLYGVKAGTVTVKATANDGSGKFGTKSITVKIPPVTSIVVTASGGATKVGKGKTLQMNASVQPWNANQSVTWSVTNGTGSATITVDGLLTGGTKAGTVTVKAIAKDGSGKFGTLQITVTSDILVFSIAVNSAGNATTLPVGQTLQMSVTVFPANATNQTVTWSISNGASHATIDPSTGLLTAVSPGLIGVRAKANDGSGKSGYKAITIIQ